MHDFFFIFIFFVFNYHINDIKMTCKENYNGGFLFLAMN